MADTPEQVAYDQELAKLNAMPEGAEKVKAKEAFDKKYPKGRPELTQAQKEQQAVVAGQAFGLLKQFLDNFPKDLKLKEAWALLLDNDIAGAKLAFQSSDYYKNTLSTADQRLKQKLGRYGVYQIELSQFIDTQIRRLTQSGISLDPNNAAVKTLLESAYLAGETENQIDIKALAFNKGRVIGGQTGGSVAELKTYAKAFGIKYSDNDFSKWSEDIFSGRTTAYDIQSKIRQDSASAFPIYADKILNGTSIDSIGSAYRSSYSTILEMDPEQVDWSDPLLRKAMQYTQNGQPAVMPVWMFENELRRDPRWQYTNNARKSVYDAIYNVKTDMGLM